MKQPMFVLLVSLVIPTSLFAQSRGGGPMEWVAHKASQATSPTTALVSSESAEIEAAKASAATSDIENSNADVTEEYSLEATGEMLLHLRHEADVLSGGIMLLSTDVSRMFKDSLLHRTSPEWQNLEVRWATIAGRYEHFKALLTSFEEQVLWGEHELATKNLTLDRHWYELRGRLVRLQKRVSKKSR